MSIDILFLQWELKYWRVFPQLTSQLLTFPLGLRLRKDHTHVLVPPLSICCSFLFCVCCVEVEGRRWFLLSWFSLSFTSTMCSWASCIFFIIPVDKFCLVARHVLDGREVCAPGQKKKVLTVLGPEFFSDSLVQIEWFFLFVCFFYPSLKNKSFVPMPCCWQDLQLSLP